MIVMTSSVAVWCGRDVVGEGRNVRGEILSVLHQQRCFLLPDYLLPILLQLSRELTASEWLWMDPEDSH